MARKKNTVRDKRAAIAREPRATPRQEQAEGPQETTQERRLSSARIVSVPLGQIVLDRYQPRPVLPASGDLREKFFRGELNWKKTASRWLEMASDDPSMERQVKALLEMGESIEKLNQIEPATGAWREVEDGNYKMFLLTGERRFWSVGLTAVKKGMEGEPHLECRELEEDALSPERQIAENETAEPLSAVGKARAIAALILNKLDLPPELDRSADDPPTDHEYYRSVLDLEKITGKKYMPRGIWEEVGETMNMGRPYMTQHLNILNLPEELQHRADRYDLPERVLREILKLPSSLWEKAIRLAAEEDYTVADIQEISAEKKEKKKKKELSPVVKAARRMKSFWRVSKGVHSEEAFGQMATEFAAGQDKEELDGLIAALETFLNQLKIRTENME